MRDVKQSETADVVMVPAEKAYDEYLRLSAYLCPVGRLKRDGVQRVGFYRHKHIEPYFPLILAQLDSVAFTEEQACDLERSTHPFGPEFARVIRGRLRHDIWEGTFGKSLQVLLLTAPGDERTLVLPEAIAHEGSGAWMRGHRYVRSDLLRRAPKTTDDLS